MPEVENISGGFGLLKTNVFLNNIGKPASNATVEIISPENDTVIEESRTDSQGQLPPIMLSAPPIENSMNFDQPRPFNQYNMRVTLEGYQSAFIQNIQVYPDTTAIQNVSLIQNFENIDIPYPTLWGDFPPKIPESEVKRLPFASNLVVLPETVVPEFIVVHAGVPSDRSAPDYTLTFKDYIKNVASSEIYASWPREALKANILAILSFTLSRVYTEWYRSKGYDFTITSSTAYDQAFFYGRNIFQEISDIVDEIFTLYISRPDINQPLFTQYSDGVRVVRQGWLSQWGSKELAEQGYSAIQILKNYYGYNIVLKEAKKVSGIPLSFSGVQQIGSRGEPVRTIQRQLNTISNNYPLIGKLAVDGIYGPKTAQAVRVFQEVFDLPVTGVVNFPTWYRISDIYNAVNSLRG